MWRYQRKTVSICLVDRTELIVREIVGLKLWFLRTFWDVVVYFINQNAVDC